MKQHLRTIYQAVTDAGVRDAGGFPLRAVLAAIGMAEGGDPDAYVPHDPPDDPNAEPSTGLFQVHRASWPEIFANTELVRRASHLPARDKMIAMAVLVKPILHDALEAALRATRTLQSRGLYVDTMATALFMNAVWQAGSDYLDRWSMRTRTGDPRELLNQKRAIDVEVSLRSLAPDELGVAGDAGLVLGLFLAFGLAGLVLSQLDS